MQFLRVCFQNAASTTRPKYPAGTTKFYRLPEVTVWPKFPKCKNEFFFRFSYFTYENEKRKRNSFFVRKFENEKRKRNSFIVFHFSNLKTKNEKGIRYPIFVRKFENEKGKNGTCTDLGIIKGPTWMRYTYRSVTSCIPKSVVLVAVIYVIHDKTDETARKLYTCWWVVAATV